MNIDKKMILVFSAAIAITLTAAPAPFEIQQPDFCTFDFEETAIPAEFSAGPGSRLSISRELYKDGRQSLRWDWDKEDAELRFHSNEAFRHLTGENPDPIVYKWVSFCTISGFSCWVFSEQPLGGALRFQLENSRFYANMNYSGWGKIALLYGRDLDEFPRPGSNTLIIRPPVGIKKGTLYLDCFAPRRELDVRMVTSTSIMPYVMKGELIDSDKNIYVEANMPLTTENSNNDIPRPAQLTDSQRILLTVLQENFLAKFRVKPGVVTFTAENISELRQRYQLHRKGDFVSGNITNVPRFYSDLLWAGRALKNGHLAAMEQQKLRELIIDMADLVIQHGHRVFYALRTYFIAPVLLLKDELKSADCYHPLLEKLRELAGTAEFYQRTPWGNADDYNTLLFARLGTIFLDDDQCRQWQDLSALRYWLDATSENGEIMPDGTFTHHQMIYTGYGFPAIGPICETLFLTRNTPFFSKKMFECARRALLIMSYYSTPITPHMFAGRWRVCAPFTWDMAEKFALLAKCSDQIDRECAARYLSFADLYGKNTSIAQEFRSAGVVADSMQGSLALNYAVALVHRHDSLAAVVRGQRNGLVANEAYANGGGDNTMGRYLNYGQLQILGKTPEEFGFVLENGWDFNFWPGTTARQLPFDALRQHFENVEAVTTESFGGSAALHGDGVWAMKLQEELPEVDDPLHIGPPRYWLGEKEYWKRCCDSRYDTAFRARKSMFFFGETIVALGSGIISKDPNSPVVTTLAQNSIGKYSREPLDESRWLLDTTGNGFYFGNTIPVIRRGWVEKPYHKNWIPGNPQKHEEIVPNAGNMELIYFNHGVAAADASYRYFMLLRPGEKRMRQFVQEMESANAPITILRQDSQAHVVRNNRNGVVAYALFEAGESCYGSLRYVDSPCVAIAREEENALLLSLFNPKFTDRSNPARPLQRGLITKIRLQEGWEANPSAFVRPIGGSEFEIVSHDLVPTIVEFSRK